MYITKVLEKSEKQKNSLRNKGQNVSKFEENEKTTSSRIPTNTKPSLTSFIKLHKGVIIKLLKTYHKKKILKAARGNKDT